MFMVNHLSGFGSRAAEEWLQAYTTTMNQNSVGWSGYTIRQLIPVSQTSAINSGTKIRVTVSPPTSGNNTVIAGSYIGHAGASPPDFDGNQVQLLWAGSGTKTLTAGAGDSLSDEIVFNYDRTRDLIVSFAFTTTTDARRNNAANAAYNQYTKVANDPSGTTTTGYASGTSTIAVVKLIEIYG